MRLRFPCLHFCPSPALFFMVVVQSLNIHKLTTLNVILNVSYFVLMCQYDTRSSYQHDTKTGCSNGYF